MIQFDDGSPLARVYTCWNGLAQKLRRMGFSPTRTDINGGRAVSWHFEVPKGFVSIRPTRKMSEAQKQVIRERFAKARLQA